MSEIEQHKPAERELSNCGVSANCYVDNYADRIMVDQALADLRCSDARGGVTPEGKEGSGAEYDGEGVGDGAGVQLQIPHAILKKEISDLPEQGTYGLLHLFLPDVEEEKEEDKRLEKQDRRDAAIELIHGVLAEEGLTIEKNHWRKTPVNRAVLGKRALETAPDIQQAVITDTREDANSLEDRLLRAKHKIERLAYKQKLGMHVASMSAEHVIYKGLVRAGQLEKFYPDLLDPDLITRWYIAHARYATNSWSKWPSAHPFDFSHNGEITTILAQWLAQIMMGKEIWGEEQFPKWDGSDTEGAAVLNSFFRLRYGISIPEALMMQFPPMLKKDDPDYTEEARNLIAFLEQYFPPHAGPAHIVYCDKKTFGMHRDPAGFRPANVGLYTRSDNGREVFGSASEDTITAEKIADGTKATRVQAERGEMIYIEKDENGNAIRNEDGSVKLFGARDAMKTLINSVGKESKEGIKALWNGSEHFKKREIKLGNIELQREKKASEPTMDEEENDAIKIKETGVFFDEKAKKCVEELAKLGKPKTVAMGNDSKIAAFSGYPRRIADFLKELWSMVTDPPLDSIREAVNISARIMLGAHPEKKPNAAFIALETPILSEEEFEKMESPALKEKIKTARLPMLMEKKPGGLEEGLKKLCEAVEAQVREGAEIIILSDRDMNDQNIAMPDAIAVAAVDKHLKEKGIRLNASIVAESGAVTDAHQAAVLLAMGASAVHPWLAYQHVKRKHEEAPDVYAGGKKLEELYANIQKGMTSGLTSILAKRHFTRMQSYIGAAGALMESVGLKTTPQESGVEEDKYSLANLFNSVSESGGFYGLKEFEAMYIHQHNFAMGIEGFNVPQDVRKETVFSTVWAATQRKMIEENRAQDIAQEGKRERDVRTTFNAHSRVNEEFKTWAATQKPEGIEEKKEGKEGEVDKSPNLKPSQNKAEKKNEEKNQDSKRLLSLGLDPISGQEIKAQHKAQEQLKQSVATLAHELKEAKGNRKTQTEQSIRRYAELLDLPKLTEPERRLMWELEVNGSEALLSCAVFGYQILRGAERAVLKLAKQKRALNEIGREEEKEQKESNRSKRKEQELLLATAERKAAYYAELFAALAQHPPYKRWLLEESAKKKSFQKHYPEAFPKMFQEWLESNEIRLSEAEHNCESIDPFKDLQILNSPARTIMEARLKPHRTAQLEKGLEGMLKIDGRYDLHDIDQRKASKGGREYRKAIEQHREAYPVSVHHHLKIVPPAGVEKISIDKVEPTSAILQRIFAGGMSYGALQPVAHGDVAEAHNAISSGGSNDGEGGLPKKVRGTKRAGKITQCASGRFGFIAALIDSLPKDGWVEIKIGQGAKPGMGGELPADKVGLEFAIRRKGMPGEELVSPPNAHDTYSIEDLCSLISALKAAGVNVGIKLPANGNVGQIACAAAKAGAERINIACESGGTAAAKHTDQSDSGIPSIFGLVNVHNKLVDNNLRNNVQLLVSGSFTSAKDLLMHALWADGFEMGTIQLGGVGCIGIDGCNKAATVNEDEVAVGGCSVGVTNTAWNYKGRPEDLERFNLDMAAAIREQLAEWGLTSLEELKGKQMEWLQAHLPKHFDDLFGEEKRKEMEEEFLKTLRKEPDRKRYDPKAPPTLLARKELQNRLDDKIAKELIGHPEIREYHAEIATTDVAFGSGFLKKNEEGNSLYRERNEKDPLIIHTEGNAGQRYAAFASEGFIFRHAGRVHDYVGTGMSGGSVIVMPQNPEKEARTDNIIAGNSCFYGATGGKTILAGSVGDRFAVRNSGINALVLGNAGSFAGEYMTAGQLIITGNTGEDLGAGMTGGVVAVRKNKRIKKDTRYVQEVPEEDKRSYLKTLKHEFQKAAKEGATEAQNILDHWEIEKTHFEILLPKGLIALKAQLQATIGESREERQKFKKAQRKAREILARYADEETTITPLERVFLTQLGKALESSVVRNQSEETVTFFTDQLLGKKSAREIAYEQEAEDQKPENIALLRTTEDAPACSSCEAKGCQGNSGCGLERATQLGSQEGKTALEQLFKRILKEAKAQGKTELTEREKWEEIEACLNSGIILEKGEAGIGLRRNEIRLLAKAYKRFAGGEYGTPLMFTANVCPAPCEDACTKSNDEFFDAVPIKTYEKILSEWAKAYQQDQRYFTTTVDPEMLEHNQRVKIAIVGSGPAGMQSALEMARRGFDVTVFEKEDRPGGLTSFGIPAEKHVDVMAEYYTTCLEQMGVKFRCNTNATARTLEGFDVKILATGVTHAPRWLDVTFTEMSHPELIGRARAMGVIREHETKCTLEQAVTGRVVQGFEQAMDFLTPFNKYAQAQRMGEAKSVELPNLQGRKIFVTGSGDTGNDVLHSLKILEKEGKVTPEDITVVKRDIVQEEEAIGIGYPFAKEGVDPERRKKLEALGITESELLQPINFRFDSQGNLTEICLQPMRLSAPEQDALHKEARKLLPVGEPIWQPASHFIMALGFDGKKPSALFEELGVETRRRKSADIEDLLGSVAGFSNVPGVFVAGDADAASLRGRNKNWTVVDALASGRDAAWQAIAICEKKPEGVRQENWRETVKTYGPKKPEAPTPMELTLSETSEVASARRSGSVLSETAMTHAASSGNLAAMAMAAQTPPPGGVTRSLSAQSWRNRGGEYRERARSALGGRRGPVQIATEEPGSSARVPSAIGQTPPPPQPSPARFINQQGGGTGAPPRE